MFTIAADVSGLERTMLDVMNEQLPFAISRALNDTAQDVLAATRVQIDGVFDRPTPYTQNSFMVYPSRKGSPEARVEQKPDAARRNYLKTEDTGGPRRMTALERLLRDQLAYSGVLQAILPADNAKLDKYGNWSTGQRNQVLSALKAQRDYAANATARSTKRNKGKRLSYFVPKSGLTPGVYSRDAAGNIGIVLAFTDKVPTYDPILRFHETAQATADREFGRNFAIRFGEALASAR